MLKDTGVGVGEGPRLPCCASSVGTPCSPDAEQGWSGVVRFWEDLAELTKITCQDDRRLSPSQSQPRNWVCSISADPSLS